MQLLGMLLAISITATELLQTKAHTGSLQGPSYFFLWAFHLCSQSGRREFTEGPQVSFSSGMNQLLLPPPPQGWCVGPRFWRCAEAMREEGQLAGGRAPGPPWGRHQDRDAGRSSCPKMLMASCGAPGPLRALNPQHYKQSGKLGIFVHG